MDLEYIYGSDVGKEGFAKVNRNFSAVTVGVETPEGAQAKADTAETNAKSYADTVSATAKSEAIEETKTWVAETYHEPYIKYVNNASQKSLGQAIATSTTQLFLDLVLPFLPTINPTVVLSGTKLSARLVNGGTPIYPLISSPAVTAVNGNILTLRFSGEFANNSVYRVFWNSTANVNEYLEIDARI